MWGASELGKLGLGSAQLSSTDSPPACVRGFGKADCAGASAGWIGVGLGWVWGGFGGGERERMARGEQMELR